MATTSLAIFDLWCQLASFSANAMPLPLTVWQMMALGRSAASGRRAKSFAQRFDVVAVDVDGGEIERAPFVEQRLEVLDFAGRAGRLDLVVVDDRGEIR